MTAPILATKLYMPPPRPGHVPRPRLLDYRNAILSARLTLLSAPAGFGKTTLVAAWLAASSPGSVAWLSLEEAERDLGRFLTYLVAALQTIEPTLGAGMLAALLSPQPPPPETLLPSLLSELAPRTDPGILVLDDYHTAASPAVERALTLLLDHLPPWLHLVIATREDPLLPLARLRAGNHLRELRAAELRFTPEEAATFLTQAMGLPLSQGDLARLAERTEGWIAGLHLAALSLQGQPDPAHFIAAFSGSHRFVLDYLMEEVLLQQPPAVESFLLQTALLDRLCGPLCDALLLTPAGTGQAMLEQLERANLFLAPLDNERRWYRYHQLFADLLRQRLQQRQSDGRSTDTDTGAQAPRARDLHRRASGWYEEQGWELEAFGHAVAAADIDRAARLVEDKGMPRHVLGAATAVLEWLASLPKPVLDSRPALWVKYASLLLVTGHTTGVEEKLRAAEVALEDADHSDSTTRDLVGHIAGARATLALTRYQVEAMLAQSRRALEYLHPNNLASRATAYWTLGYAYLLEGDRGASGEAFSEAIDLGQESGDVFTVLLATIGLGNAQELANQLPQAAETYRQGLRLCGDSPLSVAYEAHLGLARISYEWNDLESALEHGEESLHLARQYENVIDRFVTCQVFLARLRLAQGNEAGAATLLAEAEQAARQRRFTLRLPEVAAGQVLLALHQGHVAAAAHHADAYDLPLSQARVRLAEGRPAAALAVLAPWKVQVHARGWTDEQLKVLVLEAVAREQLGTIDEAVEVLLEALQLAQPSGSIRTFLDEGTAMARLLAAVAARRVMPEFVGRLRGAAGAAEQPLMPVEIAPDAPVEALSRREVEVLQLIAEGRSNQEISERLYLALSTVKRHNRNIFGKLQVQRRTEAVARARELGLL